MSHLNGGLQFRGGAGRESKTRKIDQSRHASSLIEGRKKRLRSPHGG
jgi:hypothetical protein